MDKNTTYTPKYWNHTGKYDEQVIPLWQLLVKGHQENITREGELFRDLLYIHRRRYNDGDWILNEKDAPVSDFKSFDPYEYPAYGEVVAVNEYAKCFRLGFELKYETTEEELDEIIDTVIEHCMKLHPELEVGQNEKD